MLNDGAHLSGVIGDHPAVAAGIGQAGGEQGDGGAAGPVALEQVLQGLPAQQGHIAIEHQQFACEAGQGLQQLLHGVAGAVLGLLQHVLQLGPGRQGGFNPLGLVAHHQQLAGGIEPLATGQHPFHQGGARQGLEHLGQVALHAGALPGSQHGNGEHRQGRDHWPGIYRPSLGPAGVGGAIGRRSSPQWRRQALVLMPGWLAWARWRAARIALASARPVGSR